MSQLAPRDQPAVANVIPLPRTAACYPLTPPPTLSLTDSTQVVMDALAIVAELGDRLQQTMARARPYPCALCPTDMAGWPEWQMRRHFAQHPLRDRARIVGWARAVTGA